MLNVERNRGWVKAVQHAGTHLPRGLSTDMGQAGTHHLEPRQSAGMSVTGDTAFSRWTSSLQRLPVCRIVAMLKASSTKSGIPGTHPFCSERNT